VIVRRMRSRRRNRNPARRPRCSSVPSRSPLNRARTVATSAAEATNVTAFRANTVPAPAEATRSPPSSGPRRMPAFRPRATIPFAQPRSSSPTKFGIAADEADRNGASATAERNANTRSRPGSWTRAMAKKQAAAARSETIMTRCLLNRSPRAPAKGLANPTVPNVRNNAAATHVADRVRS